MNIDEARAAFRSRDDAARQRAVEALAAGEFSIGDLELGKHQQSVVAKRVREIQVGASHSDAARTVVREQPGEDFPSLPGIPDESIAHTAWLSPEEQAMPDGPALLTHHPKTCGPCEDCREFVADQKRDPVMGALTLEDGSPAPIPTARQLLRHAAKFSSGQAVLETARMLGIGLVLPAGTVMTPPKRNRGRVIPGRVLKHAVSA